MDQERWAAGINSVFRVSLEAVFLPDSLLMSTRNHSFIGSRKHRFHGSGNHSVAKREFVIPRVRERVVPEVQGE